MEFLADENFPGPSIRFLREAGYEIHSISEESGGISDDEVIEKAQTDDLVILTFDKDFGELIFKRSKERPPAVVIFRFKGANPQFAGQLRVDLIENKKLRIESCFTVVEKENVRQRKY